MMAKSLRSMRDMIARLSQVPHDERPARVAALEAQTIEQIADIKTAQSKSDSAFDAYADALAIAEFEARLAFLRGLKFDLVKMHSFSARTWRSQPRSSRPSVPE
ncbi:hypothetical protein HFP51_13115 [Parasphingopyxis sp. CP4]|uniref:hypothetical protein n=1 Tax=Parasphingopyxis sp. CP4 TaxID=2724527 RepID=UPI0015A14B1D|nr:hypothetical protein [Parasphingopyxis sp. CP4]QLC23041.1 hypothetical protein HFP51_13115 [Parasphingopyxis sp. CP4]